MYMLVNGVGTVAVLAFRSGEARWMSEGGGDYGYYFNYGIDFQQPERQQQ